MATLTDELDDTGYKRWLKGGLVLKYLTKGFADYLDVEVQTLHTSILNSIRTRLPAGVAVSCGTCDNASANRRDWVCTSHNICTDINTALVAQHTLGRLTLANTDVSMWTLPSRYWEIGKCFLSPGFKNRSTAQEMDINGILGIIINCKQIQQRFSQPVDTFKRIRVSRNVMMHSVDMTLLQAVLDDLIKCSLVVLTDPVMLTNAEAIDAVKKITNISATNLPVSNYNEQQVLRDTILTFDASEATEEAESLPAEILRMDETAIDLYRQALSEGIEAVRSIRVMVVGHFGVGKTTLTKRLLGEEVDITKTESTEGIEVYVRQCSVSHDGKWTMLQNDVNPYTSRMANVICDRGVTKKTESTDDVADAQPTTDPNDINNQTPTKSINDIGNYDNSDGAALTNTAKAHKPTTEQANSRNAAESNDLNAEHEIIYRRQDLKETYPEVVTQTDEEQTMEKLRKELQEIIKSSKLKTEFSKLSIWDFAGQFAFYATHQVFMSPRAVYLLVTDISKPITEEVDKDECFDNSGSKSWKISDFVDFWLNSIHGYSSFTQTDEPPKTGVLPPNTLSPPVILIGTHADKLYQKEKQSEAYFLEMRKFLSDKVTMKHLADNDFAVDNTDVDPNLDAVKKKISDVASQQHYWKELIPARWIVLENELMKKKNEGEKIVKMTELEYINNTMIVPISDADQLQLFLKFQHESGNLIYFSDEALKEHVLLDPQWLAKAFKCLITAEKFVNKKPEVYKKWQKFNESAKLEEELIDAVWKNTENEQERFHEHSDQLISFLERLDIIATPCTLNDDGSFSKVEEYFFAPCVLKEPPPEEILTPSQPTFISTTKLCFTVPANFIPIPIFNRLLASCLTRWPISRRGDKDQIYCGCGIFELDTTHSLTLYFSTNVIQIWVTKYGDMDPQPSYVVCDKASNFVKKTLYQIIGYDCQLSIKCPKGGVGVSKFKLHPVETLRKRKANDIPCDCQAEMHILKKSEMLRFWFPEEEPDRDGVFRLGEKMYYFSNTKLGCGSSAEVYEGRFGGIDGMKIAVKRIICKTKADAKEAQNIIEDIYGEYRETMTLEHLERSRCDNIVGFYGAHTFKGELFIAFEFCDGTLDEYIENKDWNESFQPVNVNKSMADGLSFLHGQNIVHLDLKPSNVLILLSEENSKIVRKIVIGGTDTAEFTTRKNVRNFDRTKCEKKGFIAPEIGKGQQLNSDLRNKSDIFSLGILFYFTTTLGSHPYGTNGFNGTKETSKTIEMKRQNNIENGTEPCFAAIKEKDNSLCVLLKDMLAAEPKNRPKAIDVCAHPALWSNKQILEYFMKKSDDIQPYVSQDRLENSALIPKEGWLESMKINGYTALSAYLKRCRQYKNGPPLYDEMRVQSLLRAIRNIEHHYKDKTIPGNVLNELGSFSDGHAKLWLTLFPGLLMHVYNRLGK